MLSFKKKEVGEKERRYGPQRIFSERLEKPCSPNKCLFQRPMRFILSEMPSYLRNSTACTSCDALREKPHYPAALQRVSQAACLYLTRLTSDIGKLRSPCA
ncbi:hypothetical protein AVEN_146391-1 [Araneus ventricosus]|uniref:Uncharacterized protein n=1 Tax=Araneus ventricosus TaxID=182803 RepID=A0A4Y2W0L0_ARAVE|nr:hypothetical protein AVEN_146391-1 [Araneus ventricosus]